MVECVDARLVGSWPCIHGCSKPHSTADEFSTHNPTSSATRVASAATALGSLTRHIHPGAGGADAATFAVELGAAIARATNVVNERVVCVEVTAQL